ncbi:coenzyme F420 hydrogenase [Thermococcus sp. M39]|uniref:nickel-dependent hydrogenase large subunit n=1 Tax=unclassified Thermococcus TaxID=2627626 RepID=UPI0014391288|nr:MULTISPECIES: nickel-dependent hydrogenase large subunit [unclassified Thermococcus]NJE08037.1 coenzyme F420 hydrogenase [Thermococcus sp. M39]NJE11530.1 coenzyme F420 hydrogenase [Thermococcus sp. LS2]
MNDSKSALSYIPLESVTRIMGEAKLIFQQEDGIVQDALFVSTAPLRGFEKLVIGKDSLFTIKAVMRICGVCHVAHANVAAEAIESAVGISPPRNALLMRELLGLVNRIQTHILLLIMVSADMIIEEKRNELIFSLIKLYDKVSDYLLKLGGGATHPPYLTVGGISRAPKWSVLNHLKAKLPKIEKEWEEIKSILLDEDNLTEIADELRAKIVRNEFLASDLFFGDKYRVSFKDIQTVPYWEYREEPRKLVNEATVMVAFYKGKAVEVGPRARLMLFTPFKGISLFGLYASRILEIDLSFERMKEILNEINVKEPFRKQNIIFGPGKGVGVYEAPRGTLFHYVELDEEGKISKLKIVTPTMFNIPIIENAVKGLTVEAAEAAVRLFDPCIPCTTHVEHIRKN